MSKKVSSENDFNWRWVESDIKFYGLKVRLKSENTKIIIDVKSSINSDQHYIQQASNYFSNFIADKITGSYNISSYQLFSILATAAEIEVEPQTSDAGPLTNSWWMTYIWLEYKLEKYTSLLKFFKNKYPYSTQIELTAYDSSDHLLNVSLSDDGYIKDFNQLKITGGTIELGEDI